MSKALIESDGLLLKTLPLQLEHDSTSTGSNSVFSCCVPFSTSTSEFNDLASSLKNLIPFKNILWIEKPVAALSDDEVEVTYVKQTSKDGILGVSRLTLQVEFSDPQQEATSSANIADLLMCKAYADSKPQLSILVLTNPNSGQGRSLKYFHKQVEPILIAARCEFDVKKTEYSGHAVDIARELDISKYDIILCASGDGIPHEVINGLYQREDRAQAFSKLAITQAPCGSGNAMSLSCLDTLIPSQATLEIIKGHVVKSDLMAVSMQGYDTKLSFLSQTYGIIAEADIGTEWMRFIGQSRFELGVTSKVLSRAKYPCSIAFKYVTRSKEQLNKFYKEHHQDICHQLNQELTEDDFKLKYSDTMNFDRDSILSEDEGWEWFDQNTCDNLGIFYSGKMPYISKDTNFFPAALRNDGSIDIVVTDSRTNILTTTEALLSLDKGLHVWKDEIYHFKVEAFKLIPQLKGKKSYISIDGENFPFKPFQVELLNGIMKTIMRGGDYKATGFLEKL